MGITRAWPWCALLRPWRTVPRRSGAYEGSHFLAPKFLEYLRFSKAVESTMDVEHEKQDLQKMMRQTLEK